MLKKPSFMLGISSAKLKKPSFMLDISSAKLKKSSFTLDISSAELKKPCHVKPPITLQQNEKIMFKIKCYSKAELAMLYFPDSDPHVAVNHLMRWVYKCKPLMDKLNKTGYSKQAKYLLAQQVRIVVEHLGEP